MKPCQRGVLGRGREVGVEGDRGENAEAHRSSSSWWQCWQCFELCLRQPRGEFVRVFEGRGLQEGGASYRVVSVAEGARDRTESRRFRGDRVGDGNDLVKILWEGWQVGQPCRRPKETGRVTIREARLSGHGPFHGWGQNAAPQPFLFFLSKPFFFSVFHRQIL
jgi:hypothetical protein